MSTPLFARPSQPFRTTVPIGVGLMGAVALSPAVAAKWDDALGETLPSEKVTRMWWTTIGLHAIESVTAARRAKAAGLPAGRWAAQTMVYGMFSLAAQKKVVRALEASGAAAAPDAAEASLAA